MEGLTCKHLLVDLLEDIPRRLVVEELAKVEEDNGKPEPAAVCPVGGRQNGWGTCLS